MKVDVWPVDGLASIGPVYWNGTDPAVLEFRVRAERTTTRCRSNLQQASNTDGCVAWAPLGLPPARWLATRQVVSFFGASGRRRQRGFQTNSRRTSRTMTRT